MEQSQRPETESSDFLAGERQGLERALEIVSAKSRTMETLNAEAAAPFAQVVKELAALLPTGREDAWQPIETAPKDGTEILSIARFSEIDDWWYAHVKWFLDDWRFCNDGDCSIARPTCWQPLPPPPPPTTPKQVGAEDERGE